MREIWNLCLLQLEENHVRLFNTRRSKLLQYVFLFLLLLCGLTVLYYFAIREIFIRLLLTDGDMTLLATVLAIFFLVFTIFLVFTFLKRVYYAKDNDLFATMPVSQRQIYLSKLLCIVIEETVKDAVIVLPFMLTYCFYSKLGAASYAVCFPALLLFMLGVTGTAALVSVPVMFAVNLIRKNTVLTIVCSVLVIAGAFAAYMVLLGRFFEGFNPVTGTIESIQNMQKALTRIANIFVLTTALARTVYLQAAWPAFAVAGYCAAALALDAFAHSWSYKRYFALKEKKQHPCKSIFEREKVRFPDILKKDAALLLRSPDMIFSCFLYALIMPLFLYSFDAFLHMIDLSTAGYDLIKGANVLTLSVLVLLNCGYTATAISNEGGNFYLLKTVPQDFRRFAGSKIFINISVTMFFVLISLIVLACFSYIGAVDFVFLFLIAAALCAGQSFSSLESDLRAPVLDLYDDRDIVSNSRSNMNATLFALVFGVLLGVAAMMSIPFIGDIAVYSVIAAVAAAFAVIRILLFKARLGYYFRNLEV